MDSVAVVVLNWNGMEDTKLCLESLRKQTYGNFFVILVDNASTERGTYRQLQNLEDLYGEWLHIFHNKQNCGFAGGVNIGIKEAMRQGVGYVALLNNDAVVDKKWLASLVKTAKSNKSMITTGLLLRADGKTIDSTGDWYSVWGLPFPRGRDKPIKKASPSGPVFGASGGASLYDTHLFKDVGLFDERFFAYYEDVDISFRAQLRGHKIFYTKDAVAYHKQGASADKINGFSVYQTLKNLPMLYIKNVPKSLLVPIGIRLFIAYWLIAGNAIFKGHPVISLKGVLSGFFYSVVSIPNRIKIQHLATHNKSIYTLLWSDLPPLQKGIRRLRSVFSGRWAN
jgi:GT2 family glycosyltransferase